MPQGLRGQRLAGLTFLLGLAVIGPGCQSVGPMAQTPLGPSQPAPRGLVANVQAMFGGGQSASPTATLYPPTAPAAPLHANRVSAWAPMDRQPNRPHQAGYPIQQTGGRRETAEPTPLANIPITTLPGNGQDETLPTPKNGQPANGNGKKNGNGDDAAKPTPQGPAFIDVGPSPPLYPPHGGVYVPPGGTTPVSDAFAKLQAKVKDMQTAGPIKNAMPVPHDCPREFQKRSLPEYIIEPADVLLVESTAGVKDQPIAGEHRVGLDGTIGLGIYGRVRVAGMTISEAKKAIIAVLSARLKEVNENNVAVDVIGYNSKKYYVITDGGGFGEQVYPFPITGNETVLDAIANINGLPAVSSKRNIWVARATPDGAPYPKILPVDWKGVAMYGSASTNFQILPGDRIYVQAEKIVTFDTWLARRLSPIERIFGTTLLGAQTVNSIKQIGQRGGGNNNNNNFGN